MDNQPETAWQATGNRLNTKKSVMTARPKPTSQRPLTSKQKAFVKHLLDNPKASATQAVKQAYNTSSDNSASQIATENLRKPQIINQLERNSQVFESVIVNTAKQWGDSDKPRERELALQASYWGHDKVHGKATQRVEQQVTGVQISIDLSSSLDVVEDTQQG